ncbi:hypothetical protein BH09MYX1_BH09MYX1_65870 [soil metagenome]
MSMRWSTWVVRSAMAMVALTAAVACASDPALPPPVEKDPPKDPPATTVEKDALPPAWCADAQGIYAAKPVPGNVLFVMDRSGSMQIKLTSGDTRWIATKTGLFNLLGTLPSTTRVGAMMFPQGDAPITCCKIDPTLNDVKCNCATGALPGVAARCNASTYSQPIPIADLSAQQQADVKAYIASSDKEFYWGTPLAPALKAAVDQQRALQVTGTKSIILFTDGIPTSCDSTSDPTANDVQRIIDAAAAGSKDGVRTFVMGVIDGTKGARATNLSPVAKAGGTARKAGCETDDSCFYALNEKTYAQDIKAAFDDIALKAFDCIFDLPQVQGNATADLTKMNVQIDDGNGAVQVSRDTTHTDGWDFTPDQKHLQLHGATCEKAKQSTSNKVEIVVGCKTQGQ